MLSVWTALYGFEWERETLNEDTGESIAFCAGDSSSLYLVACLPVVVVPTVMAACMAWKTKDIDSAYSESSWIFTAIFSQLQIVFISIPVVVILKGHSTNGRHVGLCLMLFCYSMSLLCIIMFPKYVAYWKAEHQEQAAHQIRGSTIGVHISGINVHTPQASTGPLDRVISHASRDSASIPKPEEAS